MKRATTSLLILLVLVTLSQAAPLPQLMQQSNAFDVEMLRSDQLTTDFNVSLNNLHYPQYADRDEIESILHSQGVGAYSVDNMPVIPALSQWVVVPAGKRAVVQQNMDDELFPPVAVEITETAMLRNIQLAQVTSFPMRYHIAENEFVQSEVVNASVEFVDDENARHDYRQRIPSPQFQKLVESIALNPPPHRDDQQLIEARGYLEYYLFVAPERIDNDNREDVEDLIYLLMEWKRRAGNKVELLWIPEGQERNPGLVKENIQNRYDELLNQGTEPFDNIFIVADENPIADQDQYQLENIIIHSQSDTTEGPWAGHWDLWYAYLEGDDIFADVALSRFHTGDIATLANAVHKTVGFESEPHFDETDWFNEAVLEREPLLQAGTSVIFSLDWINQTLHRNGFVTTARYTPDDTTASHAWLRARINEGMQFAIGRAENRSFRLGAREEDSFGDNFDVNGIYPIALFTSSHGEYAMDGMFMVGYDYYTDLENLFDPDGAKGCVASTCCWGIAATAPNNLLVMSMSHGMLNLDLSFGWSRVWSLMNFSKLYPGDHVQLTRYSTNFQTAGEPGLRQWNGIPQEIEVSHPEIIPEDAGQLTVNVTDPENGDPLSGIIVTVYKGSLETVELFDLAMTNASGECHLAVDTEVEGPFLVTATRRDVYPYKGEFSRGEVDINLQADIEEIDDANGNGDGEINLNEPVQLLVSILNNGTNLTAENVTATLSSESDAVEIAENLVEAGDIAPGSTADELAQFELSVIMNDVDNPDIPLILSMSSNDQTWKSELTITPTLRTFSLDGYPMEIAKENFGSEVDFPISLINNGQISSGMVKGTLIRQGPGISVVQDETTWEATEPGNGSEPANPFRLMVDPDVVPGVEVLMQLHLSYQSNQEWLDFQMIEFRVKLGTPGEGDPFGPDGYGYYAFDDTDEGYEHRPSYRDWEEVGRGGDADILGDPLDITIGDRVHGFGVVELPFTFQYYGHEFDTIKICTNGFILMGNDSLAPPTFHNMPLTEGGAGAPFGMIAPFWDDLWIPEGSNIYTGYDFEYIDGVFFIQWARTPINSTNREQTFQIQLHDPAVYPTRTGDGNILFIYDDIDTDVVENDITPYQTIGITSPDGVHSHEYGYGNNYSDVCPPLQDRKAILFTTDVADYYLSTPSHNEVDIPTSFGLSAIYPNPFNSTTTVEFQLNRGAQIMLNVFDMHGRIINTLSRDRLQAGYHSVIWNAKDAPAGMYLIRLNAGTSSITRRVILVK